jgi:hypothetical protein
MIDCLNAHQMIEVHQSAHQMIEVHQSVHLTSAVHQSGIRLNALLHRSADHLNEIQMMKNGMKKHRFDAEDGHDAQT